MNESMYSGTLLTDARFYAGVVIYKLLYKHQYLREWQNADYNAVQVRWAIRLGYTLAPD